MPISASRIFHVNVNCRDLDRSLGFYRDLLGLAPAIRSAPAAPQPGAAFGLDVAWWDAWMLQGEQGSSTPVIDLLQWLEPLPATGPATDPSARGFNRVCVSVRDVAAVHRRLVDAGAGVWDRPGPWELADGSAVESFICSDPDGTQVEVSGGDLTWVSRVIVNCADLDASVRYYADLLGLELLGTSPERRVPAGRFRLEGAVQLRTAVLRDASTGFLVELIEWVEPRSPRLRRRAANHLGIFRMAWSTGDVAADHATLTAAGVQPFAPPGAVVLGPGLPDVDALFWLDPDGACLELIEVPAG